MDETCVPTMHAVERNCNTPCTSLSRHDEIHKQYQLAEFQLHYHVQIRGSERAHCRHSWRRSQFECRMIFQFRMSIRDVGMQLLKPAIFYLTLCRSVRAVHVLPIITNL